MQVRPQRTCVVCKTARNKDELIRVVKSPSGSIEIDLYEKLPGRGAYFCPDRNCIEKALKKKILAHALREDVIVPDAEDFLKTLRIRFEAKILSLLGIGWRSGRLVSGTESVLRDVAKDNVSLLVLAEDISENLSKKILDCSEKKRAVCCRFSLKEKISKALGEKGKAVVAIKNFEFAKRIENEIKVFHHLETA